MCVKYFAAIPLLLASLAQADELPVWSNRLGDSVSNVTINNNTASSVVLTGVHLRSFYVGSAPALCSSVTPTYSPNDTFAINLFTGNISIPAHSSISVGQNFLFDIALAASTHAAANGSNTDVTGVNCLEMGITDSAAGAYGASLHPVTGSTPATILLPVSSCSNSAQTCNPSSPYQITIS